MASVPLPNNAAARQDLYRRVAKENFAPLWEVYHSLIPNQPLTPAKPAIWKYKQARPHLMEAGGLITAKEATRRVLILQNPSDRTITLANASTFIGPNAAQARKRAEAYEATCYHQVCDEYSTDWDMTGAVDDARLLTDLGWHLANIPQMPHYNANEQFARARH